MASAASRAISFEAPGVRGFLHEHAKAKDGLVLTHGAGGNCNAPLLIEIANAFHAAGVTILRCDLPFRQERRSGPPFPAKAAADRAGLKAAIAALRTKANGRIFLGGHSYGGRQASMLAAEEPDLTPKLLLLSYPLHPPAKPEQLRTAHSPQLQTPAVFVHGAADPFGAIAEMETALKLIPAANQMIVIDKAGHDLKRGRFDCAPIVSAILD
jgi:uncharacterized protein